MLVILFTTSWSLRITTLQKQSFTADALVDILRYIPGSRFCGKLACRRCLRELKAIGTSAEQKQVLDYLTKILLYVPNDGKVAHTAILNNRVTSAIVCPSPTTTCKALRTLGIPPLATPNHREGRNVAEKTYEVDTIVTHRGEGPALQFLIHWRGYGREEDSWEPASGLDK